MFGDCFAMISPESCCRINFCEDQFSLAIIATSSITTFRCDGATGRAVIEAFAKACLAVGATE